MKLTRIALLALKGCKRDVKVRLAEALGVHPATIYRYIDDNDDSLTKAAAMEIIRKATGLKQSEILVSGKTARA